MASQDTGSVKLQLPEATRGKLLQFQRRVRFVKIAEGLLAGLLGLLISYLLVFGLERWIDTTPATRLALLLGGSVGLGLFFPLKCHRWVWGTRRMEQVAILLKHRFPALGDQLLGIIELAQGERDLGGSRTLAEAAIAQVDHVVRDRDFSHAVPHPRHRMWATLAAIPLALALVAMVVVPAAGMNSLTRWLMPWTDTDRYTFAQVDGLPNQIVAPHGEAFSLEAKLSPATKWSPETASAKFQGQPVVKAPHQGEGYQFEMPPQTDSGQLNLRVGDLTAPVQVQVANRPELSSLTASITLPEYLQYSKALQTDVRGGVLSILKGSLVAFDGEVSRKLVEAFVQGQPATISGAQVRTLPVSLGTSEVMNFQWKDELGLTSKDGFQLKINVVDDAAPEISFQQKEPLQVVLASDVLSFDVQGRDDYGVRKVGLEWRGVSHPVHNPNPDKGEKLIVGGSPEESRLAGQATFSAESDSVRPQIIELRAFVEDYLPNRPRVYSSAYVVHVMSPEQHAVWMMAQLRRWASIADDVYEEEMRLHDANRQIRQMDPAEINNPEIRRQIEQQAAAERTNGDRLENVTAQGEALLNQALRNKSMLAAHLETWAGGLNQLRDIAEHRMPSVADLLREGANAPGVGKKPAIAASVRSKVDTGPEAGVNRGNMPGQPGPEKKPNDAQVPAVPRLSDTESGFNKPNTDPQEPKEPTDKPPSQPKFGLPQTVVQGGPKQDPPKPSNSPAGEKVEQALVEQADLLAEFEKVREEFQKILADLENSTFVKRFKAASREQLEVASALNRTLFDGFGVADKELRQPQTEQFQRIAVREDGQSKVVRAIQTDLEAYYGRRHDEKFLRILDEMDSLRIVAKLTDLGERVRDNRPGEAIARAEFWSDTLDRWAEELVSAAQCKECKGGPSASLPPSIVLEVMRILEAEMNLREETRTLEQVRSDIAESEFGTRANKQAGTQAALVERTLNVVRDIQALPDGAQNFGKEISLISAAGMAMEDAAKILGRPDTGPEAIAAETEAIELLLQTKRSNPQGSGGGGSNPGGGGKGDTNRAALELFGPAHDPQAKIEARQVEQATGSAGEQLPIEFRDGLDAFFNALESRK